MFQLRISQSAAMCSYGKGDKAERILDRKVCRQSSRRRCLVDSNYASLPCLKPEKNLQNIDTDQFTGQENSISLSDFAFSMELDRQGM